MLRKLRWRLRAQFARYGSRRLFSAAGLAVIAFGVLCLCLSALVTRTGSWWQDTLDAFGVGFVVGGVIDILAIFGLTQLVNDLPRIRGEVSRRARFLMRDLSGEIFPSDWEGGEPEPWEVRVDQAADFLRKNGKFLDEDLRLQFERQLEQAQKRIASGLMPDYQETVVPDGRGAGRVRAKESTPASRRDRRASEPGPRDAGR